MHVSQLLCVDWVVRHDQLRPKMEEQVDFDTLRGPLWQI